MSRDFFLSTILFVFNFYKFYLMIDKVSKNRSLSEIQKELKKTNLDILTDENDRLLKSLKKPSGSYKSR